MFSGLNNFVKNILPKRLFYRALLIVAMPVIVLQLIITVVFFDSLWIKTNKGMTKALINEISTFIEVYNDEIYEKEEITNIFSIYQDLLEQHKKQKSVEVFVAVDPSDSTKEHIEEKIKATYGNDANISFSKDPNIMGGLSIKIGDETLDLSIRGKVNKLVNQLNF